MVHHWPSQNIVALLLNSQKCNKIFSRHFVYDFVRRYEEFCNNNGKIASPTCRRDSTFQETENFISMINSYIESNTLNKNNIVVFDEPVIWLPLFIGERRKSGGGNFNTIRVRESHLLAAISHFQCPSCSTPFRVFIFRARLKKKRVVLPQLLVPKKEKRSQGRPNIVILQSETGFLTIELFKLIMKFTNLWEATHPGLECFLLCDNLSIHCNKEIVKAAVNHKIHFFNIIPGPSPLKKKIKWRH